MAGSEFSGQTVIITGASMGVGAATARQFFAQGANLALIARGNEALEQIADELGDAARVMTVPLDVTDIEGCRAMLERVAQRYGRIDVLINNAGYHERGNALDIDEAAMARMVDVNLKAPIALTRMALPYLLTSGRGAVVNVASLAGRTPVPGSAVYSATKFGVRAFTLALAEELRDQPVKIASVSPGPIDTGFIMAEIDRVSDLTFSQPISTADEVAEQILALCRNTVLDRPMPRLSGFLTTLTYLFPPLGRALRPMLARKGRRTKERLKRERNQG